MPWNHINTGIENWCDDEFGLDGTIDDYFEERFENDTPIINGTQYNQEFLQIPKDVTCKINEHSSNKS